MKGEHTHRRDSLPEDRSITFYLDGRTSSPIDLPVGFSLDKCTGKLNNTWFETFLTSHLGGGTQRKLSFATDTVAPRQLHRELQTPEDLRRWAELYISETHIEVGSPVPGGKGVYESVGELFD
ncbi:unnamed protein product [Vitrella brassicaformis CCMP3155]|uniref:Uncharacterized protein n=2 Tax=Vitrella brassicaformis TaxID=1169539 RepID=A0A0G4EQQ8_VITBC|nr:unnamed protein product [Vitrella brassicaformis CCMP3155]|eukprot:CEL99966.1 unnamed protein product [Vitrella brassicaformis CCMP3155]